MYENLQEIAKLQSLALTLPMVVLSALVLWEIKHYAAEATFTKKRSQMDWVILGIALSFIGKIVESLWWFIPWSADVLDHSKWAELNQMGVFFNLIFRQMFFSAGAYCHLRAFARNREGLSVVHWILWGSLFTGQLYPIILLVIKQ